MLAFLLRLPFLLPRNHTFSLLVGELRKLLLQNKFLDLGYFVDIESVIGPAVWSVVETYTA